MNYKTAEISIAESSGKPKLRAATSFLVFLFFLVGQFSAAFTVTVVRIVAYTKNAGDHANREAIGQLVANSTDQLLLFSVLGGFVGLAFGIYVLDISVKEDSHFGPAWKLGSISTVFKSIFLGVAISILYIIIAAVIGLEQPSSLGPLAKMATQTGSAQLTFIVMALFLAPLIEEPLFRGVLLGGLNRSFGLWWAVALSNLVFIAIHYSEASHYWPAFIGLIFLSIATTTQRLRTSSIGPAIAVHFGYNLFLVIITLFQGANST